MKEEEELKQLRGVMNQVFKEMTGEIEGTLKGVMMAYPKRGSAIMMGAITELWANVMCAMLGVKTTDDAKKTLKYFAAKAIDNMKYVDDNAEA